MLNELLYQIIKKYFKLLINRLKNNREVQPFTAERFNQFEF